MIVVLATMPCGAQNAATWVDAETHADFHTAGIVLTVSGDDNSDASASLEVRPSGGVAIPGINDDFSGAGPDIGAVEYGAPLFADGFESGDTTRCTVTVP